MKGFEIEVEGNLEMAHFLIAQIERFLIECPATTAKVSNLTSHKDVNDTVNQSKLEPITCNQRQARENVCGQY